MNLGSRDLDRPHQPGGSPRASRLFFLALGDRHRVLGVRERAQSLRLPQPYLLLQPRDRARRTNSVTPRCPRLGLAGSTNHAPPTSQPHSRTTKRPAGGSSLASAAADATIWAQSASFESAMIEARRSPGPLGRIGRLQVLAPSISKGPGFSDWAICFQTTVRQRTQTPRVGRV